MLPQCSVLKVPLLKDEDSLYNGTLYIVLKPNKYIAQCWYEHPVIKTIFQASVYLSNSINDTQFRFAEIFLGQDSRRLQYLRHVRNFRNGDYIIKYDNSKMVPYITLKFNRNFFEVRSIFSFNFIKIHPV